MLDLDWNKLEELDAEGNFSPRTKPAAGEYAKTQHFPCSACGGSGKYHGVRLHQPSSECFACGGKGYFLTSEADRRKARTQRQTSKARRLTDARDAFKQQHPGITEFLSDAAKWSDFARELQAKLSQYGSLSDKQVAAVVSMRDKLAAKRAERAVAVQASHKVDLAPIRAMFEAAASNGHKKPVYRAAGLIISRAPDHGNNPGALYVKDAETGDYLGKLLGVTYSGKPAPALDAIAADPRGEAVRYGQRTGQCSCCGRELTAEASIEAGIGPICASKWGL